jgi:hypothetical protein
MKRVIVLLSIVIIVVSNVKAQDIIVKTNAEEIKSKVLEVTQTEIKYKKFENLTGPTFSMSKSEAFMIKYENGTKDVFTVTKEKEAIQTTNTNASEDMNEQGKMDAKKYYKGKKSGAGGTLATTVVLSPLIGLIPAFATTSSEPNEENLNYPSSTAMKNPEYRNAYKNEAHDIKKKKIWTNFGIGSGIWLLLVVLL